ncbi:MAG: hypothetical protein JOS17DRAFT_729306 [Linnemannia elongata]|nr:MAG: hypothetical protein JOS17DRAFT_729306 [Linnemannia elongata]
MQRHLQPRSAPSCPFADFDPFSFPFSFNPFRHSNTRRPHMQTLVRLYFDKPLNSETALLNTAPAASFSFILKWTALFKSRQLTTCSMCMLSIFMLSLVSAPKEILYLLFSRRLLLFFLFVPVLFLFTRRMLNFHYLMSRMECSSTLR